MVINNIQFECTIDEVIDALQKELNKRGISLLSKTRPVHDYLMVSCPYHNNGQEQRPSAQFRNSDGLFYCHACKECHSLPDVITYCLHENGWNWLRKNFASVKIEDRKVDIVPKKEEKKENTKTQYIPYEELSKYRYIHNYILNRGISKEILIKFDVGFDPESECITFPIKDIHGNILFIAKRSVNTKWYHYPMGVDKPLYGIYELNKFYPNTKSVIICESMINCLTCWTYGQPALALNGTGSYNQIRQLSKLPYREYILGLDPDNAGRMGSEKIINNLKTKKLLKQLVIPEGKDINDLTKEEFEALEIKNIF